MDRINAKNILAKSEKNVENEVESDGMKESETESEDFEAGKELSPDEIRNDCTGLLQPRAGLSPSNLQILLSQNDILPFIRWLKHNQTGVSFEEFLLKKEKNKKKAQAVSQNARSFNTENEALISDDEDDQEFIRLPSQPENLKNGVLKEYQLESLNWLLKLHAMGVNGILADEMGLGKTIQTVALLAYMKLLQTNENKTMKHLIIVPKVTIKNWQREITKWLPSIKVVYFYGDKEQRRQIATTEFRDDFDLVLTTFECAMKEKSILCKTLWEYLIIDEAHRIKNEKAKFSIVVRQFQSKHRLLLTGTPLQNNLHELWALLNFLMPAIFNDSEEFDKLFDLSRVEDQQKIVNQIHKLLRPFVLRRLKAEVEVRIPPKKEVYLYVGMSPLQKTMYKQILTKNIDVVNGVSKDKIQLLNILMMLKKVCNHPYLFPKVEKGPPFIDGEHIIENATKLKILDVLLKKIKNENGKVLIFSQMTTLLNILDDYCRYRGFSYCRIDGSTSSEDRDKRIEQFQTPEEEKFVFLLSTRAGGLGINLQAANVVVIYDSDWNPQVDLQAIDRAHRIGQTKPVSVYRFVTEGTVEEKIVERAAKKLKIDHLIIQRGKAIQNKVSALEMTNIIQYGVDKLFSEELEKENDANIEEILEYSIGKTEKMTSLLKNIEEKLNINNLCLDADSKDIYQFEGEDYKKRSNEENNINAGLFALLLGQRERKLINSNLEVRKPEFRKQCVTGWRSKAGGGYLHQFYDYETLDYLEEKESTWKEYLKQNDEIHKPEEYTAEDEEYKQELLSKGFSKWNKKDYAKFLRACEIYGLNDLENISKSMRSKSLVEVQEYVAVFKEKIESLPGGTRIMAKIDKFETEKNKINEYHLQLDEIFAELSSAYSDIYTNLKIPYRVKTKGNLDFFTDDEDKYLICLMFKYGYSNWNLIRNHMLWDPQMKFNFSLKIKTDKELLDRANYLLDCFKAEKNKKKPKKEEVKKSKKISKKKQKSKRRK